MTRRGIWLAIGLALIVSLGATVTADASSRLTRKEARRMAHKLGREQKHRYDLRFYEVGRPRRIGRRAIAFPYAARTHADTYCRATLRVRKRVRGRRILYTARIGHQRCAHVPADALAIESATRKAARAFNLKATRHAYVNALAEVLECFDVNVPDNREAGVERVFDAAIITAVYRPNRAMFTKYADRLDRVDTTHVVLADGITAFLDYVDILQSAPTVRHPCAQVRRWRRDRWAADAAPPAARALKGDIKALDADFLVIDRAGRFLRRLGVYPRLAFVFREGGVALVTETETENVHLPFIRK